MESIVLDLQKEAYNNQSNISTLLRKAYIVARKLEVKEFEDWINNELNGYKNIEDIPEYRHIFGEVKALDPHYGLIEVDIEDSGSLDFFNERKISMSVSSLESLIEDKNFGLLKINFPAEIQKLLRQGTGSEAEFVLVCNVSKVKNILDSVRNIVLKWSIDLEEKGILGENKAFLNKEINLAHDIKHTTINNFNGNVSNSQIQQHTISSTQINAIDEEKVHKLVKQVVDNLNSIELNTQQKKEIDENIYLIQEQLNSSELQHNKIKKSFKVIQSVLEGVGGSLIASGLIHQIQIVLN